MAAYRAFYLLLLASVLAACATPTQRINREAARFGFSAEAVEGIDFRHQIYRSHYEAAVPHALLHVYIEGDGTPWLDHRLIARDPTPRSPMMLGLMALDHNPSLYLGRPCYHGFADTPPCTPMLWTHARYSQRVVASMVQVLDREMEEGGFTSVALFGYSGGGALAMLLAEWLPQAGVVVTIAGNLDIDAWAEMHGFTPMKQSLNPLDRPPLPPRTHQLHLVGDNDSNVTPGIIDSVVAKQKNAELIVIDGFDHVCCWQDLWPEVLEWVSVASGPDYRPANRFLAQ